MRGTCWEGDSGVVEPTHKKIITESIDQKYKQIENQFFFKSVKTKGSMLAHHPFQNKSGLTMMIT